MSNAYCLLLAACSLVPASNWTTERSLQLHEWLPEAQRWWREYAHLIDKIPYVVDLSYRTPFGEDVLRHTASRSGEGHFLRILEYIKTDNPHMRRDYVEEAYVANPRYAFRLLKHKHRSPWIIAELYTSRKDVSEFLKNEFGYGGPPRYTALRVFNQSLPHVCESGAFQILSSHLESSQNRSRVRVHFENKAHDPEKSNVVQHGWVLLDPIRHWVITEYEVRLAYFDGVKTRRVCTIEYDTQSNIIPLPRRVKSVDTTLSEPIQVKEELAEYRYQPGRDIPLSQYTLSAFGLPEPPESLLSRPTPWWLYVGGAGLLLLIIAILVYGLLVFLRAPLGAGIRPEGGSK